MKIFLTGLTMNYLKMKIKRYLKEITFKANKIKAFVPKSDDKEITYQHSDKNT